VIAPIGEHGRACRASIVVAGPDQEDGCSVDDTEVVRRITELADEEHRLERSHTGEPLGDTELARMKDIEVALDQCWDLLRQRRARRSAGEDPDAAEVRPSAVVEGYRQ